MEHYVYKYQRGNEVVYVGKTDTNLEARIITHAQEKQFQPYLSDCDIYCAQLANSIETDVMEKLLINKYKPILNGTSKLPGSIGFGFEEPEWRPYSEYVANKPRGSADTEKKKLERKIARGQEYLNDLRRKFRGQNKVIEMFHKIYDHLVSVTPLPEVYVGEEVYSDKESANAAIREAPCIIIINQPKYYLARTLFSSYDLEPRGNGFGWVYRFSSDTVDGVPVPQFFVERFNDIVAEAQREAQEIASKIEMKQNYILGLTKELETMQP